MVSEVAAYGLGLLFASREYRDANSTEIMWVPW
jgi:hypothetical protein